MMKLFVPMLVVGISLGFVAAQTQEPPKEGEFFCEHVTTVKAHRCDCPGQMNDPMCKTPPNPDDPEPSYEESSKCKNHCKKDHCHCLRACDT